MPDAAAQDELPEEDYGVIKETPKRVRRAVEIRRLDAGRPDVVLGSDTHSVNVSSQGMLLELPKVLDAVAGQEIAVQCVWQRGRFETMEEIVRFESLYQGDPARQVMALKLKDCVPATLLDG
jgi:hypothetical protein